MERLECGAGRASVWTIESQIVDWGVWHMSTPVAVHLTRASSCVPLFEERASGSPPFYASPFDDTNDKNTDHNDVHDSMDLSWSESELLLSPVLKLPVTPTYDDAQSMEQPALTPPGPVALVKSNIDKHVAFSVSAGCFTYQMGVAAYMQEHFDLQGVQFTGASGGSWPATVLACGMDMEYVLQTIIDEAPKCCVGRLLGAYGVYDQGVRMVFDKLFKDCTDLPDQVRGKLAISVTRLAWMKGVAGLQVPYLKDEVISDFKNKDDIIECVLASSLIPFALNGKPWVRYRDWICVDAGVTNVGGTRRFADELKKEFTNEIKAVMDHARAMKKEVQHQAHHGFELASDPYGLLGLTVQTSKALAMEMQGEMLDSLTALRLALETVVHETLMVDELMAEVKALAAAGSSPSSSSSNGGGSSGGEATVVGMVPSLNMTAALRRYLAITRAVQGACGKVVSKVAHKVNERAVSVSDRLVSTTATVGTAVVTAPFVIGGQMLSTTAAVVGGAANLGINAASATLSATVTATTCAVNLPWAVMSGVTSSVYSALTGSNTHNTSNVPAPVELGYQSQWKEKEKEAAGLGARGDTNGGDTTMSYEDHGGYDSDHDMSMHTWVEREGRKGVEVDDDSGIASEAEMGYTTMVIEGELERTVEVVFGEEEDSDVCEDEEASLSVEHEGAPQSSAEGFHWRKKGGGIKRTAGGGLLLEITPWTWRKQPLHHYHLSSDILVMRRLFELGRQDAAAHHTQLEDFFGQ